MPTIPYLPSVYRPHGFNPTPDHWWDADAARVTQSTNLITAVAPRVGGGGVNLTNTGGATRLTWSAASSNLNNLPTMGNAVHASSLVQCATSAFSVTSPFTIFVLAWFVNTGNTNHYLFDAGIGATQNAFFGNGIACNMLRGGTVVGTNAGMWNGARRVLAAYFNHGTNGAQFFNNSASTAAVTGTLSASAFTMQGITLCNYLGGGGFGGGNEIAHIMIVNGATSLTQRQNYMGYLANLGNVTLT